MADRFWVGGSGTWAPGVTTNWSTTSGGPNGASVPTTADDVIFDQFGTYTVTMSSGLSCQNFIVSAGTVTFTSVAATVAVNGGMDLVAGTMWSTVSTITFTSPNAGNLVTTNGSVITGNVTFNGAGSWTLGSALTLSTAGGSGLTVVRGEFYTNGQSVTCAGPLQSTGTLVRAIDLANSTVTISANTTSAIFISSATNLTFNAGTSQINLSGPTSGITSPGLTFRNVAFTSNQGSLRPVTGSNTFNNFAVTAPSSAGVMNVNFDSQQTINGTLSTTGTAGNRRVFFTTVNYGISRDLVVNSAPSLTDADFRGLYVRGTAAPISGTRIGNRGECRGITFSAPKTVYWSIAGINSWGGNNWSNSSGGTTSTDYFPLPQDTAIFNNSSTNVSPINVDGTTSYLPTVDWSARTTAATLSFDFNTTIYGNFICSSSTTISGVSALTFSGGTTQTITSAGRAFTCPITIDTYGGTVQLADALNIGSNSLIVTNGTFTTAGYAVTAGALSSSNSNVRTINLGASTITLLSFNFLNFTTSTNLVFNAGSSNITATYAVSGNGTVEAGGVTFNNLTLNQTADGITFVLTLNGQNSYNNLTLNTPNISSVNGFLFSQPQTINQLTCTGTNYTGRVFLGSTVIGTQRTLTVNTISATDCDFCDIALAGAAAGTALTRAGNCGNNTGITFPAAKTVYWNLAGTQNWSANGWAATSGGTPAVSNFPLAQDTAVFDNAGAAGTVGIDSSASNIGTLDASLRTNAMTFTTNGSVYSVYGDWKFGTGVTFSSTTGTISFSKNGTQTITSNGVQFGCPVTINHPLANVQLADALSLSSIRTLTVFRGTFDAVTYNVTVGKFANISTANTLRMGAGTWTLSGTDGVWDCFQAPICFAGTSTVVLSDTSTLPRSISGTFYFNKFTIGGATGTSTVSFNNTSTFGEIASTKTVAHTISFAGTPVFGKWSVTGTAGNVVTIVGSTCVIAGPAVTGVDYLAMGAFGVSTTSPGEFYAGANSTGTAAAPVFRTAAPAPRTLYWVGGTGAWSNTSDWDTTSGGGGGAAIPTSLDAVVFNSASNATAYTATISGVTLARCASFTMAGPASGNVTFAGSVGIAFHGSVSFAATGITRTYTGAFNLAGNSSYTFTTNGVAFISSTSVIGIGSTWTLGSALSIDTFFVTYGAFSTSGSNYAMTVGGLSSNNINVRTLSLNGSTLTNIGLAADFSNVTNFTFNAGASQINLSSTSTGISSGGLTFNNVSFTSVNTIPITGANTFNTLSFTGRTSVGVTLVTFGANQTISTLTLNAGTASAFRTFLGSSGFNITRTLTVGTLTAGAADIDFRDITIAGAAAPLTGTRFGDAKGNSGITFPAAKTVYWAFANNNDWGSTGTGSWSATNGGARDATQFPLAQDTAFIPFAIPNNNQTITINPSYNIGTLDMNERNGSALVTLSTGSSTPAIYGNWINGTGTTLSGSGTLTFAGRGSQTITSAGRTFTQQLTISTSGGSVTLQDALTNSNSGGTAISHTAGTFSLNSFNCTLSGGSTFSTSASATRTLDFGSNSTLSINNSGFNASQSTNLTVVGTGTFTFLGAISKTFTGGTPGVNYSGITLNQGGAGTLTISGNNTFKDITNTYSATGATTINLSNTTQTLTNPWTATGEAGRVLTISGVSAASPATLIFTGLTAAADVDYLAINNVRAYDIFDEWYAGPNSTNGGSLGWYFIAKPAGNVYAVFITESASGVDAVLATVTSTINSSVSEAASGIDAVSALGTFGGSVIESASGIDAVSALAALSSVVAESASGIDVTSALASLGSAVAEAASGVDSQASTVTLLSSIAEAASAIDATAGGAVFAPIISEAASGIDAASASAQFGSAVAENASGVDAASALASLGSVVSESTSGVDSVLALVSLESAVAETAGGVDDILAFAAFEGIVLESASGVDDVASSAVSASVISEAASGVDAASSSAVFTPAISETASGIDAVSSLATLGSAVSETASGVDTVASSPVYTQSIVEAASGVDAVESAAVFTPVISETASGLDSISGFAGLDRTVSETATAVTSIDSIAVLGGTIAETASGVDTTLALASLGSAVSETASGIDTVAGLRALPGAISEAASGVDSNSVSPVFASSASETASGIDAASALTVLVSAASETASGLDSNAATVVFTSFTSEVASGLDAASSVAFFGGAVSEAASGVETVSPSIVQAGAISETVSGSDSNVASAVFTSITAETASGFDLASALTINLSAVTEVASGLDGNAATVIFTSSASEAASGIDAISSLATFGGIVLEAASGIDSTVGFISFPSSISETASGADAASGSQTMVADASEAASGADSASTLVSVGGVVSEASSGADVVAALAALGSTISEASSGVDATASSAVQLSNVAETASGVDSLSAVAVFQSQVTEASSAQEIVFGFLLAAAQVSESASGADQVSALRALAAAVVEAVSGSDAVSANAVFQGILQEIATLTDSVNAPGSTYNAPVVELAQLSDAVQAAATFPSSIAETATGEETNSAAFIPLAAISESATATDVTSALAVFAAQTAESASIADEVSPPGSIYNAVVLAVAQMLDSVNAPGSIYNAQVLESSTLADSLIGAYLWNLIDDSQTPAWGDVDDTQVASWVLVDDTQSVSWQNVPNSQTPGWTDINDDQTPGWTPILP